ncbi:hypothetical protein HDV00_003712 [Rhizophlyctis rosea]|nr:hypothetical protein HDV00_003712 [Rhizophlyctis rosea]
MAYRALGFQRGKVDAGNLPQLPSPKSAAGGSVGDDDGSGGNAGSPNRFTDLVKPFNKKQGGRRGAEQETSFTGNAALDMASKVGFLKGGADAGDTTSRGRAVGGKDAGGPAKRRPSTNSFFKQNAGLNDSVGNSLSTPRDSLSGSDREAKGPSPGSTLNRPSAMSNRQWTEPGERRDSSPFRSPGPGTPTMSKARNWTDPSAHTGRALLEEQLASKLVLGAERPVLRAPGGASGRSGGLVTDVGGTPSRTGTLKKPKTPNPDTSDDEGRPTASRTRTLKADRQMLSARSPDATPAVGSPAMNRVLRTSSPDSSYKSLPGGNSSTKTLTLDDEAPNSPALTGKPRPETRELRDRKKALKKTARKKSRDLLNEIEPTPRGDRGVPLPLDTHFNFKGSSIDTALASPLSPLSPMSPISPISISPNTSDSSSTHRADTTIESDLRTLRPKAPEDVTTDEAVRQQTAGAHTGGRPIERAVSVHQRGPFKYELSDFLLQKTLGQGAFAKVYLVKRNIDGKLFALKSMRKDRVVNMKQVRECSFILN